MWVAMTYANLEDSSGTTKFIDASSYQSRAIYMRWVNEVVTVISVVFALAQLAFWLYFITRIVYRSLRKKSTTSV